MKLCLAQRRQASLRAVPRFEQSLIILLPSQTSNWHTPQSSGPVVVAYTWKVFVTGSVWWGKLIQKVLWLFANALNVVQGIRIHSATKGTFHVIDGKDPSVCCSYHLFFVLMMFFCPKGDGWKFIATHLVHLQSQKVSRALSSRFRSRKQKKESSNQLRIYQISLHYT